MTKETDSLYHRPTEIGFWTPVGSFERNIKLEDESIIENVIPVGIEEQEGTLVMVLSTREGDISEPIDNFPGLRVVRGDSEKYAFETSGELLIEFNYLKVDEMESKPRRIRPTGISFGILGDTEEESARKGGHRAMGESADYYLEGHDMQYFPGAHQNAGFRRFPFWRIGVWGEATEMKEEYLPQPSLTTTDE